MDITCIYDQNRQPQMLGQRLGGGGGRRFTGQQRPDLAVKVYHADVQARCCAKKLMPKLRFTTPMPTCGICRWLGRVWRYSTKRTNGSATQ